MVNTANLAWLVILGRLEVHSQVTPTLCSQPASDTCTLLGSHDTCSLLSGTSFSGQITSNVGYRLVGTAGDQEEHGSFELLVKTVAVVRGADVALARMTTWTYRSRTHQGLGSEEQIVTDVNKNKAQRPSVLVEDRMLHGLGQTPTQILQGSCQESEWMETLQPHPSPLLNAVQRSPGMEPAPWKCGSTKPNVPPAAQPQCLMVMMNVEAGKPGT